MNQGNPHVMINLAAMTDKPKYKTFIKEAHNGYIVTVKLDQSLTAPISQEEAQRRLTEFMNKLNEEHKYAGDPVMSAIEQSKKKNNISKSQKSQIQIVGPHVFKTYSEMMAFLSFVYEQNEIAKNEQEVKPVS